MFIKRRGGGVLPGPRGRGDSGAIRGGVRARGLKPHPYLHLAELLPRLLLALRGGRVLGSQVLQLRLQLLAGGHGQGALLAFLVALQLRIPQLRGGRDGQAQGTGGPGSLYVLVT